MAADLDFGSVPSSYLEIFDILCPGDVTSIDREMFFSIFSSPSGLTRQNLAQIWEIADSTCQGNLKRTGIFKALALIAFAQQGKQLTEKLILKFSDEELPSPDLGDLQNLRAIFLRLKMQKSNEAFLLGDIISLDSVQVTLVPEKKGLFLKHTEYEVTSERYKASVQRRYNDFLSFHELLLQRFPFRLIPQLPPKKMMGANAEFIEDRRKALKRFLNLVARHPTLSEDRAVQFFLTFVGTDIQHKIKDYIRNIPEELETNPMDHAIPDGGQVKLHMSREQMRQVLTILYNIRTAAKKLAEKCEEDGDDILIIGKELNVLSRSIGSTDSLLSLDIGNMTNSSRELSLLYPHFGLISQTCSQMAENEREEVVEKLDILLDLLMAYKELGDRFDVENNQEPPNPNRPRLRTSLSRQTSSPPPSPGGPTEEAKNALSSWECRRTFALSSLLSETKLIQAYLGLLPIILYSMVTLRTKWLQKLSTIWEQMTPMVVAMKGDMTIPATTTASSTLNSPDSPAR